MKRLLKTVHVEHFEEYEGEQRLIRVETKKEKNIFVAIRYLRTDQLNLLK